MAASSRDDHRVLRLAHRTVGPLILRRFRVGIHGHRHMPAHGPVILASNHVSYLDNYVLSSATQRPPRFLGKAELAEGWFGKLNRALGMVPVDRGRGDWTAIEAAVALLRAGEIVALFPEGTRSTSGDLHKFRSGMARIAAAAQAPVVPVGLRGTRAVWPPNERLALRRPASELVTVHYGPAIPPPADTARARRAFTAEVRRAVARLSQQSCVETYAPVGPEDGELPAVAS